MVQSQILEGKIGLEIHVYLITKEKLFCNCRVSRERGLKENSLICPICTGMPGAKPMLPNKNAVEKSVMIGLMLGCKINSNLIWQRKHYDWPDLPKGYQNTLSGPYAIPVGVNGKFLGAEIREMHLEEDPASWEPLTGKIDYNRSGLPLVEIVTEPDFSTAEEVVDWLRKLLHNLEYLKAVDSNAGIKVDVNINIPGKTERVEVKNINSLDSIKNAIEYELKRQSEEGSERETRRYDEVFGKTVRMRGKENAQDYRFISDPDLQDIYLDKKFISEIEKNLPESPEEKLEKIIKQFRIDTKNAEILIKNFDIAEFFERVSKKIDAKFALPWITIELRSVLNYNKKTLSEIDIKIEHFVSLLNLIRNKKITELQGKDILRKFKDGSFDPVEEFNKGGKISNEGELRKIILLVLKENKKSVEDYKNGEEKAFNFLMGKVMEKTERRADYSITRKILESELS